ncbi:hypothetical protein U1Q18_035904, partial [Sarracenia purpurea var. burkii]
PCPIPHAAHISPIQSPVQSPAHVGNPPPTAYIPPPAHISPIQSPVQSPTPASSAHASPDPSSSGCD